MLKVYAHTFIKLFSFMQFRGTFSVESLDESFNDLEGEALVFYNLLVQTDLITSIAISGDLIDHIRKINQADDHLVFLYNELTRSIMRELGSRNVFLVPSQRDKYYDRYLIDKKQEISDKCSDIIEDIAESGNCFAVGRYTACVFHLMRVMEKSVQYFGKKIKVNLNKPIQDETWYKILKALKIKIDAMDESTQRKRDKKDRYQATYAHLDSVRIAWRNRTMHPKNTYTEDEAKTLLSAVEIFIKDLIEIL